MSDTKEKEDLGESFRQSRKELWFMLVSWAVFLIWTLSYNSTHAFDMEKSGIDPIIGMPQWVFFGILVPWVAALVLTICFAMFFMKDTELLDVESEQASSDDSTEGGAS